MDVALALLMYVLVSTLTAMLFGWLRYGWKAPSQRNLRDEAMHPFPFQGHRHARRVASKTAQGSPRRHLQSTMQTEPACNSAEASEGRPTFWALFASIHPRLPFLTWEGRTLAVTICGEGVDKPTPTIPLTFAGQLGAALPESETASGRACSCRSRLMQLQRS